MKLGFVSAILPEFDYRQIMDFADANGFRCVELMCWPVGKAERRYGGVTHIDMDRLDDRAVDEILSYAAERNVEISATSYYPNHLDPDPVRRTFFHEHFKKVILGAERLGVHNVNTFIGRDQNKNLKDSLEMYRKEWPDLVRFAEDHDVKIGIESCPMYFTNDEWPAGKNLAGAPRIWRELFSIIDSPNLGINFDPSHFVWQHMNYIKPIYEFKDKIFHVHIKDAHIYQDRLDEVGPLATPLEYHVPKIPGLGDVDWGQFVSALRDIKFQGNCCIEVEDYAFEDCLNDRLLALLQSKAYMDRYILNPPKDFGVPHLFTEGTFSGSACRIGG